MLAAGVLIVFVFDFLLRNLRGYFVDSAGRMADVKLASRIFEQVLGIRMAARPASAGAFANNLREFESLRDFFTSATLVTLVDLPFVLLFIAIIWLIGGPVALVPAIAVPLVIGVGLLLQLPLNRVVAAHVPAKPRRSTASWSRASTASRRSRASAPKAACSAAGSGSSAPPPRSAMRARFLAALGVNFSPLAQNLVTVGVVIFGVYRIADGRDDGRRAGRLHHHHRPRHGAARPGRRHPDPLPSGARRATTRSTG